MQGADFWNDQEDAKKVSQQAAQLKEIKKAGEGSNQKKWLKWPLFKPISTAQRR